MEPSSRRSDVEAPMNFPALDQEPGFCDSDLVKIIMHVVLPILAGIAVLITALLTPALFALGGVAGAITLGLCAAGITLLLSTSVLCCATHQAAFGPQDEEIPDDESKKGVPNDISGEVSDAEGDVEKPKQPSSIKKPGGTKKKPDKTVRFETFSGKDGVEVPATSALDAIRDNDTNKLTAILDAIDLAKDENAQKLRDLIYDVARPMHGLYGKQKAGYCKGLRKDFSPYEVRMTKSAEKAEAMTSLLLDKLVGPLNNSDDRPLIKNPFADSLLREAIQRGNYPLARLIVQRGCTILSREVPIKDTILLLALAPEHKDALSMMLNIVTLRHLKLVFSMIMTSVANAPDEAIFTDYQDKLLRMFNSLNQEDAERLSAAYVGAHKEVLGDRKDDITNLIDQQMMNLSTPVVEALFDEAIRQKNDPITNCLVNLLVEQVLAQPSWQDDLTKLFNKISDDHLSLVFFTIMDRLANVEKKKLISELKATLEKMFQSLEKIDDQHRLNIVCVDARNKVTGKNDAIVSGLLKRFIENLPGPEEELEAE